MGNYTLSSEIVYMLRKEAKRRLYLTVTDEDWSNETISRLFALYRTGDVARPSHKLNDFGFAESIVEFSEDGGLIMNLRRGLL